MITYACGHTEANVAHRVYSALKCDACKAIALSDEQFIEMCEFGNEDCAEKVLEMIKALRLVLALNHNVNAWARKVGGGEYAVDLDPKAEEQIRKAVTFNAIFE